MNQDWMNDPELDQLPTTTMQQRADRLDGLKALAEREQPQAPPSVPSHYATSLSDLRRRTKSAVLPTPPVPVPNPAPNPATPTSAAPNPAVPTPAVRLASLELKNVVDMDRKALERGKLLPECADALIILGAELGIEDTMEHIAEVLREAYRQRLPNPNDRYSALERALELRETRLSWEKVVSQLNAEGYRNQQGEPWKMHALRRACERHADKTGRSISVRGTK